MKWIFVVLLLITAQACIDPSKKRTVEIMSSGIWWTYLADYDGLPGSTIVNLGLRRDAPVKTHPILLVTGVNYESEANRSGFPTEADLDFLNRLNTKRLTLIAENSDAIFAGSFTHNGERLDYFYLVDGASMEEILLKFYNAECSDRKAYVNIKSDPEWVAYLNFLYPNKETIERNRSELRKLGAL